MKVIQADLFGNVKTVKRSKRNEQPRTTVLRVLNLGAGRQSSTLAEMIVVGALPRVDFALFADTGDEPKYVYQQVEYLRERLATVGIPLAVVKRDGKGLIERALDPDSKFVTMPLYTRSPDGKVAILRRQCTSEFKIEPCDSYVLNWLIEQDHAYYNRRVDRRRVVRPGVLVENIYGISYLSFVQTGKREG